MSSFCSYFNNKTCRSCTQIEVEYSEQLKKKENLLTSALSSFEGWTLHPSVASRLHGFRNKAKMTITGSLEMPIIGLLGEEILDEGREILNCPVHHPKLNEVLALLPDFIRLAGLAPYEIKSKKGELKGTILYFSEESDEGYLRLILRSKESIDRIRKYLPWLLSRAPYLTCISVNIQPVPHALLEGNEETVLTGKDFVRHILGHMEMRLGPRGFVQTNQSVATELYKTAAQWSREVGTRKFAELFCGQGAFSFFIAPETEICIGIEINPEAVKRAQASAQEMGISNVTFKCADAADVARDIKDYSPDLLLVNPPRRGLGESVELLIHNPVPHLIYSSCSLESLAKDMKSLREKYEIKQARLFDMFPHTEHFETLLHLEAKAGLLSEP